MGGLPAVAKEQQRFRSRFFETWSFCLQGILMGFRDKTTGKAIPVLTPEKRRRVVNAIVNADGFQVRGFSEFEPLPEPVPLDFKPSEL